MKEMERIQQGERLRAARERLNLSKADVYTALGIPKSTYEQYENGRLGLSQVGDRLARYLRVDLAWLLTARGKMDGKTAPSEIAVFGVVGAGASILPIEDDSTAISVGDIQLPSAESIGAVIIKGDSGYPRFQNGEILIFYTRQLRAEDVLNRQAIVQTWEGRKMIKTVRRGREKNLYTLESFNAPPEHDVEIMAAWQIYGLLFCR